MKSKILFALIVLVVLPNCVKADGNNYINSVGVEISNTDYEMMLDHFSEERIEYMSQDTYNLIQGKTIGDTNTNTTIMEYSEINGVPTEREVPTTRTGNTFMVTGYKTLSLSVMDLEGTEKLIEFANMWTIIPSKRVFDVIALRFTGNTSLALGTQTGEQLYEKDGTTGAVFYSNYGTNINRQSNGFGISMNLIDGNVASITNIINCLSNGTGGQIFASYQHATKNVTLAQSKDYYLDYYGLGHVVKFNSDTIKNKYDNTAGLSITAN